MYIKNISNSPIPYIQERDGTLTPQLLLSSTNTLAATTITIKDEKQVRMVIEGVGILIFTFDALAEQQIELVI